RCLLITHGLSGSGKTTLSSKLVDRLGLIRLRSDVERKRLHGLSALARSGSSLDNGLYHASATDATYQRMALLAQVLLQAGFAVLVDATFLQRQHRQSMVAVAEQQGVPFVILSCEAAPAQVT